MSAQHNQTKSFFSPPSKEADNTSYLVYILCWTWIIVNTIALSFVIFLLPHMWIRWVGGMVLMGVAGLIALWLNYKGHTRQATFLWPLFLWLLVSFFTYSAGGIIAPVIIVYIPVILTTGFLLGGRWGSAMATLCVLSMLGFVLLETNHLLPPAKLIHTPFSRWVGYLLPISMVVALQYYATNFIQASVEKLKKEIDERAKVESELNALNESLEKRVTDRTGELVEANRELEAFNYTVSHDLQAPLRTTAGYAKIILKQNGDKLDTETKELLKGIVDNSVLSSQLIRDLLDFSKLGKKELARQQFNMNDIVNAVVDEVKQNATHDFKIIRNAVPDADSDPQLIKQVWVNLISNAVKYSRKKHNPLIEVGMSHEDGKAAYFVKDNGDGFDMQHAHKLFEPFKRLHSMEEFEGTGVGLATVQRIITKHGGKIWANAKPGEGATFYFTLA